MFYIYIYYIIYNIYILYNIYIYTSGTPRFGDIGSIRSYLRRKREKKNLINKNELEKLLILEAF